MKPPRIVFWELTSRCNLKCLHCRRTDLNGKEDFSTKDIVSVLESFRGANRPSMIVFSGGEPLLRKDFQKIAGRAKQLSIPFSVASNGTLIDSAAAKMLAGLAPHRVSISLDGADAAVHDTLRGEPGSFEKALNALRLLKEAGVATQINCSITTASANQRDAVIRLVSKVGVCALHFFLLVPVGCGASLPKNMRLDARNCEEFIKWFLREQPRHDFEMRATCAPHQTRIFLAKKTGGANDNDMHAIRGCPANNMRDCGFRIGNRIAGCLAGISIAFISHRGEVFPCGYLPMAAGNLKNESFREIWENSKLFKRLRRPGLLKGKCWRCGFREICRGCRARAYAASGDIMAEDPFCIYQP